MSSQPAEHGAALIDAIRESIIGGDEVIDGPFGARPVVYADYTASGRALGFIEDYLRDQVMPLYANTHTDASGTGRQTGRFREDARELIRRSVGADRDEHAVLFCGSGATHAIDRMIRVLGLRIPESLDGRYRFTDQIPVEDRPVVFIGPFEHHSNELPWRESIAEVVTIDEDPDGHIDIDKLAAELTRFRDRPLLIGSFSAASNVTGIMSDTDGVSRCLHEHGALAFWDYAAAAPYLPIEMGQGSDPARLDAVFISPHKLIGGPQTPGVLVARRELFTNSVPAVPGGGTVQYVNGSEHRYLDDIEHREEGGTPAIIESIRAGMVFQLKDAVGAETIHSRETEFAKRAISRWADEPTIEVLGNRAVERLSIVSFVVRHPAGYLHHNFVVALLDDLFGIQSRGGCSCAGPYGHRLLGIDLDRSHQYSDAINQGCDGIKPGWVRINFNYFLDAETVDYLIDAVSFVGRHGHRFLDDYRFDLTAGLWRHESNVDPATASLIEVDYSGTPTWPPRPATRCPGPLTQFIDRAHDIVAALGPPEPASATSGRLTDSTLDRLRWFPLPRAGAHAS